MPLDAPVTIATLSGSLFMSWCPVFHGAADFFVRVAGDP
jgi:hypothetical protein